MRKFGHPPAERVVDLLLPKGVVEVVIPPDDMSDAHVMIVDDDREVVGRRPVRSEDDQIVELGIRDGDLALDMVTDRRRTLLRRLQPDRRRDSRRSLGWVAVAPRPVVAYRALLGARARAHRFQLCGRAVAVIGPAGSEKLSCDLGMP